MPRADLVMLATDYLITIVAGGLGLRLLLAGRREGQLAPSLAGLGLQAIGLAALVGGSGHGLESALSPGDRLAIKQVVRVLLALAGFVLIAALARAVLPRAARRKVVALAAAKASLAALAALTWGGWSPSEADGLLSLAALLALAVHGAVQGRFAGAGAATGAAGVGLAGILLRRAQVSLPPHLRHDDVFHLVACGALWLVHAAARGLRDRS